MDKHNVMGQTDKRSLTRLLLVIDLVIDQYDRTGQVEQASIESLKVLRRNYQGHVDPRLQRPE